MDESWCQRDQTNGAATKWLKVTWSWLTDSRTGSYFELTTTWINLHDLMVYQILERTRWRIEKFSRNWIWKSHDIAPNIIHNKPVIKVVTLAKKAARENVKKAKPNFSTILNTLPNKSLAGSVLNQVPVGMRDLFKYCEREDFKFLYKQLSQKRAYCGDNFDESKLLRKPVRISLISVFPVFAHFNTVSKIFSGLQTWNVFDDNGKTCAAFMSCLKILRVSYPNRESRIASLSKPHHEIHIDFNGKLQKENLFTRTDKPIPIM